MYFSFFFKPKTAYEMRISDWSSDVCSSDLGIPHVLVDRSLVLNDVARDRSQQAVDQAGQALGIAPVELGDASEAAHIGEQQRHLPGFAAQYQALRAERQLAHQGRPQVLPEGAAHEAALAPLMEAVVEDEKSVDAT